MQNYFNIALIIISIALVAAIMLQSRGGGLGAMFGGEGVGGQYKTRRGLEKTLFLVTISLAAVFFILVIVSTFFITV